MILELLECIVGLSVEEAAKKLNEYNYKMRVINRDNRHLMVTKEYDCSRCNVYVVDNVVIKISGFG